MPFFNQNIFQARDVQPSTTTPQPLPNFAKRLTAFSSAGQDRKPSLAVFHGNLIKEQKRQSLREQWKRILLYFTILFIGLLVGIAIGHYALPERHIYEPMTSAALNVTEITGNVVHVKVQKVGTATSSAQPTASVKVMAVLPTTAVSPSKAASTLVTLAVSPAVKAAVSVSTMTSAVKPTSTSASSASGTSAVTFWKPTAGTTFHIQLSSVLQSANNLPSSATAYDIDLFDTPASTIAGLKAAGKKVICYFSAGTAENWRTDYSKFTAADLGADLSGWAGEKWVDTRTANVRKIMLGRLQLAKSKGCDAVDPDNVNVFDYGALSGFTDLTRATSINYLSYLANQANALGLAIGLKNSGNIIPTVHSMFQFSIAESCADYDECSIYQPFITDNKPVFSIQYPFGASDILSTILSTVLKTKYCPTFTSSTTSTKGLTTVLKHRNLDAWAYQC